MLDDRDRLEDQLIKALDERDFWAARARTLEDGKSRLGYLVVGALAVVGAMTVLAFVTVAAIELL